MRYRNKSKSGVPHHIETPEKKINAAVVSAIITTVGQIAVEIIKRWN